MDRKRKIILGVVAAIVALAVIAGVAIASGGDETPSTTTSSSSSSAAPSTTEAAGPTAPLTGLPLADEGIRNRPLLTVKIDNSPEARPQYGLDKADAIVEEKVEGSISRFMALYHSQDGDPVGPVRSLRTTDAAWLRPEGGMIAYSGGIPAVRDTLKAANITDIGADTHGVKYYKRRSGRPFDHSLTVQTPVLRDLTPSGLGAPKPLYEFLRQGEAFGGTTATPLATVQGAMGPGATATRYAWTWDPSQNKWLRTTDGQSHLNENTGQIAMTNVIIQYTPYRPTRYRDRANSVVDEAVTTGSGEAWILSGGKMVQGRWNRPGDTDITSFTDSTGAVVKLTPGQTWLQLVPADIKANPIAQ